MGDINNVSTMVSETRPNAEQELSGEGGASSEIGLVTWGRLVAVLALISVWVVVGEWSDFYVVGLPGPFSIPGFLRLGEVAALWVLAWSGIGWYGALRQRTCFGSSEVLLLALFPMLVGIGRTLCEIPELVDRYVNNRNVFVVQLIAGCFPTVFGALGFAFLWFQASMSIRWLTKSALACRKCQYDLTGNESGICPECGTPLVVPAVENDRLIRKKCFVLLLAGLAMLAFGIVEAWVGTPLLGGHKATAVLMMFVGGLQLIVADTRWPHRSHSFDNA